MLMSAKEIQLRCYTWNH